MIKIKKNIVEAIKFLNKNNESLTKVSELYKIDRHTLSKYCNEKYKTENLYMYKEDYYFLDEKELTAINDYIYTDINFADVKKKYNFKQETFQKKLLVYGYATDRKYKLNYDRTKFEKIETEEDAYILGLILADGYINEKYCMLRIKLHEKDIDIMYKICDYFKMDYSFIKTEIHNITGNKEKYISVYDKNIVNRLKSYGLFQAKSNKEVPFYNIDKKLQKHYIRGIFDGDGFISKKLQSVGFCGSKEVLSYIAKTLNEEANIECSVDKIYTETNVHKLRFDKKDVSYKIAKYLYEDSTIFLNRKKKLYDEMVKKRYRV